MAKRSMRPRRRSVAAVLIAALIAGPGSTLAAFAQQAPAAPATGRGSISGELFQADGDTALEGARAYAINVMTGQRYISEVVGRGGNYSVGGLPAGSYDLVVEINGGVFVADNLVDVGRGESVSRSYAIQPMRPANRMVTGLPPPQGSAVVLGGVLDSGPGGGGFWTRPGGILLLAVLAAGAGFAIADDDEDASPSTP